MKKAVLVLTLVLGTLVSNSQIISKVYDKYDETYNFSFDSKNVYLSKTIKKADTTDSWDTYYIRFDVLDSYTTFTAKDAVILFEDNTKMELGGDVDIKYYKPGLHRYIFTTFDAELIRKIADKKIIGFKLGGIFDKTLPSTDRVLVQNAAKKIINSKL